MRFRINNFLLYNLIATHESKWCKVLELKVRCNVVLQYAMLFFNELRNIQINWKKLDKSYLSLFLEIYRQYDIILLIRRIYILISQEKYKVYGKITFNKSKIILPLYQYVALFVVRESKRIHLIGNLQMKSSKKYIKNYIFINY